LATKRRGTVSPFTWVSRKQLNWACMMQTEPSARAFFVDHPLYVDSHGTPKQVVLCVPRKTKGEGRSQYSADGEESKASEDKVEHTVGVAPGPGAGARNLVDDRAPVPPPPMTKRFHTLNPESCCQHFGYRNRKEMVAWMKVHFPDLQETYSVPQVGKKSRELTDFEQACLTKMFFRTNTSIGSLASQWDVKRRRAGKAIEKWSKEWEFHAKLWSRLTFSRSIC